MPNEIAVSRQQVLAVISEMISEGIVPSSGNAIPVRAHADSQKAFDKIRSEAGEEVFKAAEQIWGDYAQAFANGEMDAEVAALERGGDAAALPNPADGPEVLALEDITPEERGLILAAGALARRRDANGVDVHRMPERTAQWHNFVATAPNSRAGNALRMSAPAIFNHMPCFAHLSRLNGPRAVDQIKVAVDYDLTPANPMGRQLLADPRGQQLQRLARATGADVDNIGTWIANNALRLHANKMKFKQMMGYEPDVLFAVSEDESFLLVRERTTHGSPINGRSIYAWQGGRRYYQQNPEALLKLVEMMTAANGIEIDFSPEGARRALLDNVPAQRQPRPQPRLQNQNEVPLEVINARAPARQPAPAPQPQARPAAAARQPEVPQAAAPQPAPKKPVAREVAPVTQAPARRPAAAQNGRFTALGTLRQELGFEMSLVPARSGQGMEQAAHKKGEDGFIVVFANDKRKLPLATEFLVEHRSNLKEPGDELGTLSTAAGKDEFRHTLETLALATGFKP